MSTGKESRQMVEIKSALSLCSSETVRLVQPLLQLPAVQHMLLVFLSDRSRLVVGVMMTHSMIHNSYGI